MMSRPALSLRSKFILIVLGGAVLPLALLGLWLNRTAERSGEELLRTRLEISLSEIVDGVGLRWLSRRSQLLRLAESAPLQEAMRDGAPPASFSSPSAVELATLFVEMEADFQAVALAGLDGEVRWTSGRGGEGSVRPSLSDPVLPVRIGIHDNVTGVQIGALQARVRMASILPGGASWGGVSGSVLAILDPATGASLLPLSIDPALFARERFVWGEEQWLTVHRTLHEPSMQLALAAPVSPFTQPFQEAARRNLWILGLVAVAGFFFAALLTRRTTRALVRLATAAEAVSLGELDRRVEETSGDEVGRVARAFNSMTESLQRTLRELSQREALAAVGEFAASLAHEVRNPLTSVRLDLQRIEEELPQEGKARGLVTRALGEMDRVNRSVTGALRVARSGSVHLQPLDLFQPLKAAFHASDPEFRERNVGLFAELKSDSGCWVKGDTIALEQLFLNLLLNAAQAVDGDGRVEVGVDAGSEDVVVSIRDSGRGISEEDLQRVAEPFFSTRREGTGLGLAIAQRIAQAHGRELEIESTPGVGTTVRLHLPASLPPGERDVTS